MTSCHSVHSIPRLLHYIVTLLIAKIVPNYEFKLEILIVLYYCGISNMVSRRLLFYLFISKYSFACYLFVFRFFFFFFPIVIKLSYARFLAVGDNMQ